MTRENYFEPYMGYEIKRKERSVCIPPPRYYSVEEVEGAKINFLPFQFNAPDDCYRELLVSFIPIIPMLEKQVKLEEADYIIFAHGFARCEDMAEEVLNQIRWISTARKKGAEIIVVGKSANAKELLKGEIDNITFVGDHYAEYLGKRFGFPEVKEQYLVYDDYEGHLSIWPVDGCNNKCSFCRRSYMYIKFESLKYTALKEQLDWYQEHKPDQMKKISLRAENLTEYGIDLYRKPMLHKIIELIDSYEAVKEIEIPIGLCIGEITEHILEALCNSKKITMVGLNLEAGSDRLLRLIGKKHTCDQASRIFKKLREANPKIYIYSTVMVGLPTETISDMYLLADLIHDVWPDHVRVNFYINNQRAPLNRYPQLSESLREYHLKILRKLLRYLKRSEFYEFHSEMYVVHGFIWGKKKHSRKWIKYKERLEKRNENNRGFPYIMPFQSVVYVFDESLIE